MAYNVPTITELIARATSEFETRLPGVDAKLRRSNLNVLSRIHAAATNGLYGFLNWLARQFFPDTSEAEFLQRQADIWGIKPKPAAQATGVVTFTGSAGLVIPKNTKLQRQDNVEFTTVEEATFTATSLDMVIIAVEGGDIGNIDAATQLTLVSPIAGISSTATVDSAAITGGSSAESDDDLRKRLLARIQQPPHGGASFDYIQWALQVAGVTRAWVYPMEAGDGTVVVRFVTDNDPAGFIPNPAKVAEVDAYIQGLRPVTAVVTVVAPVAVNVDIEITGLSPNNATTQAAVQAELLAMFARESEPGQTVLISHIREAVSIASGENDHQITMPSNNVTHATNEMPELGTVTFA